MNFVLPAHMQNRKLGNIKRFPALVIDLTQDKINWLTPGNKVSGLTQHQKAACRLLAQRINWHPMYVAECCPMQRPELLPLHEDLAWEAQCQDWQNEHDSSIEDLAKKYEQEFTRVADRLFEPLDIHSDEVLMSAHDNTKEKYPCSVKEW